MGDDVKTLFRIPLQSGVLIYGKSPCIDVNFCKDSFLPSFSSSFVLSFLSSLPPSFVF